MDEKLIAAVAEHLAEHPGMTGFLLVTFEDGRASITANYSPSDEVAADIIEAMHAAFTEDSDEIGEPIGSA